MQYRVLLHRDGAGRYEAVSLTVLPCAGKGENRNEALMDLKRLLQNWLHSFLPPHLKRILITLAEYGWNV